MTEILIIPTKDANEQTVKQIKLTLEFQGKTVQIDETGETNSIVKVFVDNTDIIRIESSFDSLESTIVQSPRDIYDILKLAKSKQSL